MRLSEIHKRDRKQKINDESVVQVHLPSFLNLAGIGEEHYNLNIVSKLLVGCSLFRKSLREMQWEIQMENLDSLDLYLVDFGYNGQHFILHVTLEQQTEAVASKE